MISKQSKYKQKLWNTALCACAWSGQPDCLISLPGLGSWLLLQAHCSIPSHCSGSCTGPSDCLWISAGISQLEICVSDSEYPLPSAIIPICEKAVHKLTVIKCTEESKVRLIWTSLLQKEAWEEKAHFIFIKRLLTSDMWAEQEGLGWQRMPTATIYVWTVSSPFFIMDKDLKPTVALFNSCLF